MLSPSENLFAIFPIRSDMTMFLIGYKRESVVYDIVKDLFETIRSFKIYEKVIIYLCQYNYANSDKNTQLRKAYKDKVGSIMLAPSGAGGDATICGDGEAGGKVTSGKTFLAN